MNEIIASSFGVASILDRYRADGDLTNRLSDVLHALDAAVRNCRIAAFETLIQDLGTASDTAAQFERAITSRAVIDQAKGILMARHHLSADDAFRALRDRSQHTNRKLRLIAQDIVDNAQRPVPPCR